MCKTIFNFNNKLHQHIYLIYERFKTKTLIVIILNTDFELKISSTETTLNYVNIDIYTIDIVKSDTTDIIDKSDCNFHN